MGLGLSELKRSAIGVLEAAGVPTPQVDAELLLAHVLGVSRGELTLMQVRDERVGDEQRAEFERLLTRRAAREPLQHITGRAPFRNLELLVGPGVFVPRPETELLAQYAIDALVASAEPEPIAVDLGTGSGAIALSLATEVPHSRVFAVEKEDAAFSWARKNVAASKASNVCLEQGELLMAFAELDGQAAVVVSNPPYIPADAVPRDIEVAGFDPASALYGGPDGLDVVREVVVAALRLARSGGVVLIEHADTQGAAVRQIMTELGLHAVATHRDFVGRDRLTVGYR